MWDIVRKIALAREVRFQKDIQASSQTELAILGAAMLVFGTALLIASRYADRGEA